MRKYLQIIIILIPLTSLPVFSQNNNLKFKKIEQKIDSINSTLNLNSNELKNQNDSIITSVHKLHSINQDLQFKLNDQAKEIKQLTDKIENPQVHIFKEFIYPILLSIIAAIIFWFAFSLIPERKRKKKIREKTDLDIYQIYTRLFSQFDIALRTNNHSPSEYQEKIRGGKLKNRDIEIGLQNKCLNEHCFYDPNLKDKLLPIGKVLYENIRKIEQTIDRIYNFSIYLDSEEILLLENIRKLLNVYDLENYNKKAVSILGEMKLYPVNPSLSYMKTNFSELYILFLSLQEMVFTNKLENREIFISKIQYYFYSEQYEKTIKEIKIGKQHYSNDKSFLEFYSVLSEYKLGSEKEAYKKLESIFESKPHLVSNRNFISELLPDEKISELLNKYFSEKDLKEFEAVINKEQLLKKLFITNAKGLEDYYKKKSSGATNKK